MSAAANLCRRGSWRAPAGPARVTPRGEGRTTLVTDALRPLIGKRADGGWGRGISTWVIVTTLIGNPTGIPTTSTAGAPRASAVHPARSASVTLVTAW